jgi:hypothetical protein
MAEKGVGIPFPTGEPSNSPHVSPTKFPSPRGKPSFGTPIVSPLPSFPSATPTDSPAPYYAPVSKPSVGTPNAIPLSTGPGKDSSSEEPNVSHDEKPSPIASIDSAPHNTDKRRVDFTRIAHVLDRKLEELDRHGNVKSTIVKAINGSSHDKPTSWSRQRLIK